MAVARDAFRWHQRSRPESSLYLIPAARKRWEFFFVLNILIWKYLFAARNLNGGICAYPAESKRQAIIFGNSYFLMDILFVPLINFPVVTNFAKEKYFF